MGWQEGDGPSWMLEQPAWRSAGLAIRAACGALDACGYRWHWLHETEDDMTKTEFSENLECGGGSDGCAHRTAADLSPPTVLRLLRIEAPVAGCVGVSELDRGVRDGGGLELWFGAGTHRGRGETVWMFTALVRMLVAVFPHVQITGETMAPAWARGGLVGWRRWRSVQMVDSAGRIGGGRSCGEPDWRCVRRSRWRRCMGISSSSRSFPSWN